jgi:hypothetical protein
MNAPRFLNLVAMALAPCAFAADSTKPALPEKTVPALELKNKSAFSVPAGTRNPFLPIGWKGAPVVTQTVSARHVTPADAFRVSSILIGSPSLAVINGKTYEEGQMIKLGKVDPKSKVPQARAKVYRITDGAVQIQIDDQMIVAPLKRGTLNEIQPDTPLDKEGE